MESSSNAIPFHSKEFKKKTHGHIGRHDEKNFTVRRKMTLWIACKWSEQMQACPGLPCELSDEEWLPRG